MTHIRRATLWAMLLVGCERAGRPAVADSATAALPPGATATTPGVTTGAAAWDRAAGQLLLIAGNAPDRAFVFVPDSATAASDLAALPHPALVSLLGRTGSVQAAALPGVTDTSGCYTAILSAAPPPKPWNAGFFGGVVTPLAIDSTASISPADSASLVVMAARLASALPNDSAGRFTGLPFVVRRLWRFTVPGGPLVVVANTERDINQEATPMEERTLLVAERGPEAADSTFALAYAERSYGQEETIETHDFVDAVLIGDARTPAMIVARDFGDSVSYALIERAGNAVWRVRWTSARASCGK